MTTNGSPYETPAIGDADDSGPGSPLEFTLTLSVASVNIGLGTLVTNAEVFNGQIPGPTIRLTRGQTVCIRLINNLMHPTGIHWHGIELANHADGTEVTQDGAPGGFIQTLGNGTSAGGTMLYRFTVTRPGIYWYHPHHHNSQNRLFRGAYGMIVVTDPQEANLLSDATTVRSLPRSPDDTLAVVLSDAFVSLPNPPPGGGTAPNARPMYPDPSVPLPHPTGADAAEWYCNSDLPAGGTPVTAQNGPTPTQMVTIADEDGTPHVWAEGEIPNAMRDIIPGTVNNVEGNIVLTNGMIAGGRYGTPDQPRALMVGGQLPRDVDSGQGVRLQIVNCATKRYFRLRLTYPGTGGVGIQVPIVRVGGEGGLLDRAILEGGSMGSIPFDYGSGEVLVPPATRVDVVFKVPEGLASDTVLTVWTRDFKRIGNPTRRNWSQLPTVAVMHFKVVGVRSPPYNITGGDINLPPASANGTLLLASPGLTPSPDLKALATTALRAGPTTPPATPSAPPAPTRPAGFVNDTIRMTRIGIPAFDTVNGVGDPSTTPPTPGLMPVPETASFNTIPHIASSRYASTGSVIVLHVSNETAAHHPFHLHGFSFQPISMDPGAAGAAGTYTWNYNELRDTIDIPPNRSLTFRVRLDPRPLADGVTAGGALGRWLIHCHIFFHHEHGMISELVVTSSDGREKPTVKIGGSWAYAVVGDAIVRDGVYHHPNGLGVSNIDMLLGDGTTTIGSITDRTGTSSGTFKWRYTAAGPERTEYVYATVRDVDGRKDQAPLRLQVGQTPNTAWDVGDPHLHNVDGQSYDFQAAGEFVLLRDREGMEIQTRQTPVETPPPVTDGYSGLTACVSLNTAVAARVGRHRVSFQAFNDRFRLLVDGKPSQLTLDGIELGEHRVSGFDVGGNLAMRIDYANGTVVTATPLRWDSYGIWYLDVSVTHTSGTEGIIGRIPKTSWLPLLPSGENLGPRPENLYDRYVALYQTFANAWRVTDETSMFWYGPGTSTETFTDRDWPHPPVQSTHVEGRFVEGRPGTVACKVKAGFAKPLKPITKQITIEKAKEICQAATHGGPLFANCVFDVATTGDPTFARGYALIHQLEHRMTRTHLSANKSLTRIGEPIEITAMVGSLFGEKTVPTGSVTFYIDGANGPTRMLDQHGRAHFSTTTLAVGQHRIRAEYTPDGKLAASSSPSLLNVVVADRPAGSGTGAGPGPCGAHGKTNCPDVVCIVLWNASKLIHKLVDQLRPCHCGGDHTEGDHPHDDSTGSTGSTGSTEKEPDPDNRGGHGHDHGS